MKKNAIVFTLLDSEKIIIELTESLKNIYYSDSATIAYLQENKKYVLANDNVFSVRDNIQNFINLLTKALSNKLPLHQSLKPSNAPIKDIGYFFNESRQSNPGIIYDIEENGDQGYWSGMKYMFTGADVTAWIYNNDADEIIFELTPVFPGDPTYRFDNEPLTPEEQENSLWYEEWIKNYKPILIRTIPREIAQQWLAQANEILATIEDNIRRLIAEGKF